VSKYEPKEFGCTCLPSAEEHPELICIGCQANRAIAEAMQEAAKEAAQEVRKTDIAGFNEVMRTKLVITNEDDTVSGKTLWIETHEGHFVMVGMIKALEWERRKQRLERAKSLGQITCSI
jgi:hypothetical protein